jgi:hypothetical protein
MSQDVRDAVFGNVGSMIAFRMGADDARSMQKYFEPKFEEYDLVHMDNRNFVINMTIDGEKTPAFSATTLNLPEHEADQSSDIIEKSRGQYAVSRASAEEYIHRHYGVGANQAPNQKRPASQPKASPERQPAKAKTPPEDRLSGVGHAAVAGSDVEVVKPKRRRRRRSKKSGDSLAQTTETDEHTIFKR